MFFKGKFFPFKKISNSFIKIVFPSACSHLFFFFCFIFPFTWDTNNWESRKPFFPKGLQTILMSKFQACHETWIQGRFPGFSLMHMALAQRIALVLQQGWEIHLCRGKKDGKWKIQLQGSLSAPLLKPGLVLCCSSHQLWQLSWIAVDHLKCFPCQLSTESCWNGSLLCSEHSLLAMPSWWLSPIPRFF